MLNEKQTGGVKAQPLLLYIDVTVLVQSQNHLQSLVLNILVPVFVLVLDVARHVSRAVHTHCRPCVRRRRRSVALTRYLQLWSVLFTARTHARPLSPHPQPSKTVERTKRLAKHTNQLITNSHHNPLVEAAIYLPRWQMLA